MPKPRETLALNEHARRQSASDPTPVQETVKVAVLPPRLPPGLAPGNGQGTAGAVDWDANVNWQQNNPLPKNHGDDESEQGNKSRRKSLMKLGLTSTRKKANPDMPPFRMRTVPYDVWRKHYAKDQNGNYMGTHAPAEDCLLKPEDVKKWSALEPETYADTWTRGRRALPGYGDVVDGGGEEEHDLPVYVDAGGGGGGGGGGGEGEGEMLKEGGSGVGEKTGLDAAPTKRIHGQARASGRTIDGKSSAQVIAEAKAREASKPKGRMNSLSKLFYQ